MRNLQIISALLVASNAFAIEPKPIAEVDITELTAETQIMLGGTNSIDLVWWVPVEFWEANLSQSVGVSDIQKFQMLDVLSQYSLLAVVQADVSNFGAFRFYDEETVAAGLRVRAIDADGNEHSIAPIEDVDPDMMLLLRQMTPILAQAMGNMGESFYFFPLPAFDAKGDRLVSPYESGTLKVSLQRDEKEIDMQVDLPLNALFIPRLCPNGQPAHVSWKYCPWSGDKLPK